MLACPPMFMKQKINRLIVALTAATGLIAVGSAQGQIITTLSDFNNFHLSVTYANWNPDGSLPINGGSGFTPILTSHPNGFEVQAQAYGSGAYDFTTPISAPGATTFSLTFTINTTMVHPDGTGLWFGPNLDISDGTHMVHLSAANAGGGFLNYGPYVGPRTYTLTGPLTDQNGGAPLDTTTITAFNLEVDPAEYGGNAPYDITYNSLVLITPVPEPTTFALLGLGGVAWLVNSRRRRQ